jgi:hypothetical protein
VFAAIQQRLIDFGVFTPSTIFVVLDREAALSVSPSTLYGVIEPGRWRNFEFDGGGRNNVKIEWEFAVVIMAKILLDQGDRAGQWLLNASGTIAKAKQVYDALLGVDLLDSDGNGLLTRGLTSSGGNVRGRPGKYGELSMDFTASFVWNQPTPYTSPVY